MRTIRFHRCYPNIVLVACVVLCLVCRTTDAQEVALTSELSVIALSDDVCLFQHRYPWSANSLAVLMPDSTVVIVDTPYTPRATGYLLTWLDAYWGKGPRVAIVTGFHIDNLGGVQTLVERDIPVYGAEMTAVLLRERSAATMATMDEWLAEPGWEKYREGYRAMTFVASTVTYPESQGLTLSFGGELLHIFWPGPSHTDDNTVVYFPSRGLLFGGCMICNAKASKLGFVGDANLEEWPRSLEKVRAKFPDAGMVIPGHGAPGDISLIAHTLSLFP